MPRKTDEEKATPPDFAWSPELLEIRDDPIKFLEAVWMEAGLEDVAPLSDVERDIFLFACTGEQPNRVHGQARTVGILGPRQVGKTTLITATLTVYRGFRDPNRKILIISKSATAAKEVISLTKQWINTIWFLRHLAPLKGTWQSNTTTHYDFGPAKQGMSKQPSVKAMGNDGMLEGNRAHTIIPDDIETKGNTQTQDAREGLVRIVANEITNILYTAAPGAKEKPVDPNEVVFVGTYKHEDSVYKNRATRGYEFRTYPLAYPQIGDRFVNLAPIVQRRLDTGEAKFTVQGKYEENPVFPLRFGRDDILRKMADGGYEFGMEHMLCSELALTSPFPMSLNNLMVHVCPRFEAPITAQWGADADSFPNIACIGQTGDRLRMPLSLDPVKAPYQRTIGFVDPAGLGSDKAGLACVAYLNGFYWVKVAKSMTGGTEPRDLRAIAVELRASGATEVWVESNADILDTYAPALEVECRKLFLKPGDHPDFPKGWACVIATKHVTGIKEVRICDALATPINTHRMIFDPSVLVLAPGEPEFAAVQFQIARMRRVRKWLKEDGAVDALASCVARFQESTSGMRVDPDRNRGQRAIRQAQEMMKEKMRMEGTIVAGPRTFTHGW